jgi:hypothetical protein
LLLFCFFGGINCTYFQRNDQQLTVRQDDTLPETVFASAAEADTFFPTLTNISIVFQLTFDEVIWVPIFFGNVASTFPTDAPNYGKHFPKFFLTNHLLSIKETKKKNNFPNLAGYNSLK